MVFLAKEIFFRRPDVTCFSLNPALSKKVFREGQREYFLSLNKSDDERLKKYYRDLRKLAAFKGMAKAQKRHDSFALSALNPRLPFGDSTFDAVFDSFASIYYGEGKELERLAEIIRILRSGGLAAVGPVCNDKGYYSICGYLDGWPDLDYQSRLSVNNWEAFHIRKK